MNGIIDPYEAVARGYITNTSLENIQPNSIDLTVASLYTINGPLVLFADKKNKRQLPQYNLISKTFNYDGVEMYKLDPGVRYQIEFRERLKLPSDVCGITLVRSTMAKSGCTGENGLFDSGYEGATGMMVSVQAESFIEVGASIAQMIFFGASASKMYDGFYQKSISPLDWK